MVRLLATAGANLDAIDYKGRTTLREFALNGSRAVTPTLEYEDVITNKCPAWVYALFLRFIIDAGADPNVQDDDGMTPLHLAVSRRESVMIEILLRYGVNAMITNNDGILPLSFRLRYSTLPYVHHCRLNLFLGSYIDAQDDTGATPLHLAVSRGETVMIQMLLQNRGCSVVNRNRHRLLHFAVSVGPQSTFKFTAVDMYETVQLLCAGGIDVNEENESGLTPLHLLARFGPERVGGLGDRGIADFKDAHIGCVRTIIQSGAKINLIDMRGCTALWHAVRSGETAMVPELLKAGADMEVLDVNGERADQIPMGSTRNVVVAAAMVVDHLKKVKEAIRMRG
ncbi:ankyrin [Morchella conica CCBAS932]|uniref:Ankyrin n=1 Tax=Morchella conica CCBAS932 TaxID=1392247 RepID=A0A3N4KN00_9PEZI|nr:ankyrin [Morchella conica CCBAS932]